ncbi:MAG: hypothetical protein RLZZ538_1556, partial [Actinomycetota bacterium]
MSAATQHPRDEVSVWSIVARRQTVVSAALKRCVRRIKTSGTVLHPETHTTRLGESIDESVDEWVTAKRPMDGKCQPTAEYIGTFTERINGGESAHACAHHRYGNVSTDHRHDIGQDAVAHFI